jgi:endogenous inhibitor of DNA gyrase (YacG/DUF329 family)
MTEACPICGEPVDEDEDDPHGHFDTTNVPCTICGELPEYHSGADHEYESGI